MIIILTPQESEEFFHNALCSGLGYMRGYGLKLEFDKKQYDEAKSKLTNLCYEDILMQILKDGNKLTMVDIEGDGDMTRSITLEDIHAKMNNVDPMALIAMRDETDDANTADVIIQTIFFDEVIFG